MKQLSFGTIKVEKVFNGIEMGVLQDGTPYLTGRGLAKMCGVSSASVLTPASEWLDKNRSGKLAAFLVKCGVERDCLYVPIMRNGVEVHAFPDDICTVFIRYYAAEARNPTDEAKEALDILLGAGLRLYIYGGTGYRKGPTIWQQFYDRVMSFPAPPGYFGVFHELSQMVLSAIRGGLVVDSHTVPDGSVGIFWSKHWHANDLAATYGDAKDIPLVYPAYFPQAAANGMMTAKGYPEEAVGAFRRWLREEYLPKHFPAYLTSKEKQKALPPGAAGKIAATMGGIATISGVAPLVPPSQKSLPAATTKPVPKFTPPKVTAKKP